MNFVNLNGTRTYYEDTGPAESGETLVFSHGLLMRTELFARQVEVLRSTFRCISYDHPGQGRSDLPPGQSPISIDALTRDAATLIETLELGRVHFCGLSMGGFVGMRLAARRGDLVKSLVLIDTSARPEGLVQRAKYLALNLVARTAGPKAVMGAVVPLLFGPEFRTSDKHAAVREQWLQWLSEVPKTIHRSVSGVLWRPSAEGELSSIAAPTLVVVGDDDRATPPECSEQLARDIRDAELVRIPNCGHSSTIEQPEAVNEALLNFYRGQVALL